MFVEAKVFRLCVRCTSGLLSALLIGCFETQESSKLEGPGSETVGLYGVAEYGNEKVAAGSRVIVRPIGYFQDTSELAPQIIPGGVGETNALGAYRIAPLLPEEYAVEIQGDSGTGALVYGIVVAGKLTQVQRAELKPVGGIKGTIKRLRPSQASVFVQVAGMDRLLYISPDSGNFLLKDLPEGQYTLQALSSDPAQGKILVKDIQVVSGKFQDIGQLVLDVFSKEDYSGWTNKKTVTIRTGKAGANLTSDLFGYPLLVRLNASNFPFDSSVSQTGADIRFASSVGKALPYQIESWDASAKSALIWVKIDTIRGGDDTQKIKMYWGNRAAPNLSYGPVVFDSADGYRGVWHMSRQGKDKPAPFLDASSLGNSLVTEFPNAVTTLATPLASGAQMDGVNALLSSTLPLVAPQTFSVSIWFKGSAAGKLIGFEESFLSKLGSPYDRHLWVEPNGTVHFGVYIMDPPASDMANERILVSAPGFLDGGWHQAVGIQSPEGGQRLYLDGKLTDSDSTVTHAEAITGYWILGAGRLGAWSPVISDSHFSGALDEARIAHRVESADWIKFNFETQKAGSLGLDGQSILIFSSP
jgi:hypothetical protein